MPTVDSPGMEDFRLWDAEQRYSSDFTAEYCKGCSPSGEPCAECPQPRLLPECEPLVRAFSVCQTQWRAGGMGGRTGLDYTGCHVALEAHRARLELPDDTEAFEGIQIIEAAMLTADAEERKRRKDELGS